MTGGLLSNGTALVGYFGDDDRWAWGARLFWCFSCACLAVTAGCNIREFGNMSEKTIVLICGTLRGSSTILIGLTWIAQDDEFTAGWGYGGLWTICGAGFHTILPPVFYFSASSWKKLSDQEPSNALTNLFKSLPSVLPPTLYTSAASLR